MAILRFLFLKLMYTDQVADLNPPVEASSGQEWKFQISIFKAHIGRSSGRSKPPVEASSGQEWQFKISILTAHIGRSSGRSKPPWQRHLVAKNGNFRFLFLKLIQADQVADLNPLQRHLVDKNGNFRFLFLKVIQADQVADLNPPVEASSGQEWKFQISIFKAHIGRSSGRSKHPGRGIQWPRMAILDFYS